MEYQELVNQLQEGLTPEQKVEMALDFMEKTLTQEGTPHFKDFWEARKLCLELFKENIAAAQRNTLWSRYSELSRQARRLKEILDEQSAFAVEQIDIAIKDLEHSLASQDLSAEKTAAEAMAQVDTLAALSTRFGDVQHEISVLNAYASRINVLREELIKTDMRIRTKNDFFKRLSALGDKVYPRRKQLIKQCSSEFLDMVEKFLSDHFASGQASSEVFRLREEIKSFQQLAKQLSLNPYAFKQGREKLSGAWDKLKEIDKERRRDRAQKKALFKQNADALLAEIAALEQQTKEGQVALKDALARCASLQDRFRKTELGREELTLLREALSLVRQPLEQQERAQEEARRGDERVREEARKQKVEHFAQRLEQLINEAQDQTIETLEGQRELLIQEIAALNLQRAERYQIDQLLRRLKDVVSQQKDAQVLALANGAASTDVKKARQDLKTLLQHRKEVKEQLASLKSEEGASGLDFARAMELRSEIQASVERLEKIDEAISDLERRSK